MCPEEEELEPLVVIDRQNESSATITVDDNGFSVEIEIDGYAMEWVFNLPSAQYSALASRLRALDTERTALVRRLGELEAAILGDTATDEDQVEYRRLKATANPADDTEQSLRALLIRLSNGDDR